MEDVNNIEGAGWLVYFNGIEVPASSVSVNAQAAGIPQASINLPPDATMRRIGAKDRVRVTVFYYDSYYTLVNGRQPDWRLLFDGEIVDWQYVNSSGQRRLQYTALDMIAVLTQLYPVFVSNIATIVQSELRKQNAGGSAVVNPLAVTQSLFTIGLSSGELIRRPYDFVINIFRLLLGEGAEDTARAVVSEQWFSRWAERVKIVRRIYPTYDKELFTPVSGKSAGFPILEAVQDLEALRSLQSVGNRFANNSSFYAVVKTLFQHVYYDLCPVLAPPIASTESNSSNILGPPEEAISRDDINVTLGLGQHITQPKNIFGIPPKCNVIWPSMVTQSTYKENFATQPTRTYLGDSFFWEAFSGKDRKVQPIIDHALTQAYPEEARAQLERRKESEDDKVNVNNYVVYPEEFFKGPVYQRLQSPAWFGFLANQKDNPNNDNIMKLYTAMEHFRKRYEKRNGGVDMIFNPYVVTGQSCVIIDNIESNQHTYGYVASVQHSLTQESMSTRIRYTHGQTFEDFYETLSTQIERYKGVQEEEAAEDLRQQRAEAQAQREREESTSQQSTERAPQSQAPADFIAENTSRDAYLTDQDPLFSPIYPIEEMREKFQRYPNAREHYQRLFWHGDEDVESVFDWREIVGVDVPKSRGVFDQMKGGQKRQVSPIKLNPEENNVVEDGVGYIPHFDILPEYQKYTQNARAAMEYVSRPVCTLDEYIEFNDERGTREGLRVTSNPREGKIADYYVKILRLVQGPGVEPEENLNGDRCSAVNVDTVKNWEARFIRYRDKIYFDNHPHEG